MDEIHSCIGCGKYIVRSYGLVRVERLPGVIDHYHPECAPKDPRLILIELREAAKLVYQEGFTDSYCEFCDRHAPKNREGRIIGFLQHDPECIMEALGAVIKKAEEVR